MAIDLGGIGGSIGVFVVLAIIAIIAKNSSERRALYGEGKERKLVREEELGSVAKVIVAIERRLKKVENEEKGAEKEIDITGKEEKKQGEQKSEEDINKAAGEAAEAAKNEGEVELYTEALEGRGVGVVAAVKAVMDAVVDYLARVRPSMIREEQDVKALENLTSSLNNTGNFSTIDGRVVNYLRQIFESMIQVIMRSVEDEHEKETHHGKLVKRLKEVAKEAWKVIKSANTALRKLTGAKKKERKYFKNELRDISKAFKDKKREIKRIKKSKEADPTVLYQLRREAVLLRQQQAFVAQLDNQLQNTYLTMDMEAREMRKLLRKVTEAEKQVKEHEGSAGKREKAVEKRYDKLKKFSEELEKSHEGFTNPHEMAIEFSGKLSVFYQKYGEIIVGDLEFDGEVRNIILLHITITIQMQAYRRLNKSLEQAENAVDQGLAASTEMIAAIVGGQNQKANLKNLIGDIKKAGGEINYETRVNKFLQQLTKSIENGERSVNEQIGGLINEDNRILGEINTANQKNSSHIGQTMGTMMDRKLKVDNTFMGEARKFEQQLGRRNKIAVQAYRQAIGLKARARRQETIQKPGAPRGGHWVGVPNKNLRTRGWSGTWQQKQRRPVSSPK